ncbi:MAG: acyl-CoA dehydrogenase [Phototrophicales bacterium]|nr:MAG: acyl-CoA dehydrogenase [Phototrophicales bacterium]
MDFDLTSQQIALQTLARDFANTYILPVAGRNDREEHFPHEIIEHLKPTGLLTPTLPSDIGGLNADFIGEALVFEEIGKACSSVRTILSVHNSLVTLTIQQWGSESQRQHWLPRLAVGDELGCFALTEFTAGSDATHQQLKAEKIDGGWRLNGRKAWVSSGTKATVCLLFAQTDADKGHRGIAAFLVPTATAGFVAEKVDGKTGLRAAHTAHLNLTDVEVADEALLGVVGEGFKIAMSALDNGRYGVAAGCVGQAQACLDATIAYATQRQAFQRPLARFQLVQEIIADMTVNVEAARLLVYRAGHLKNQGLRNTRETSIAKLFATECAVHSARQAIQAHGAVGFTDQYSVERHLRDALATTIYEGTSQIQKLIIGRAMTGENAFV